MTTEELFERHQVIALDSNVLTYLLECRGPLAEAAGEIVDGIESGAAAVVPASVALTEIVTRPATLGEVEVFERCADELGSIPHMRVVALDAEMAVDAAWGRSGGRDLGDVIHIATARRSGATCCVTNDRHVRGRCGVVIVPLAASEIALR